MHEIKAEETTRVKIGELEFAVGNIWRAESGKLTVSIHAPRHSELAEEFGEVYEAFEGDSFRVGAHVYEIGKIMEGKELGQGKYEKGHIVIRVRQNSL